VGVARVCVFCGDTPVDQEHVFPQWLGRLFTDDVVDFRATVDLRDQPATTRAWKGRPFSTTVGGPCRGCNSGWMSELESRAAPLLRPMVRNFDQRLDAPAQHLLATWAVKTMLMLRLVVSTSSEELAADSYSWLYQQQSPLPGEHVWVASYAGEGQWPAAFNYWGIGIARPGADFTGPNAHCCSLAIGHLAFGLAGHALEGTSPEPVSQLPPDACARIWPTDGAEVDFPCLSQLAGDDELRTLALPREWIGEKL
jgi:hypothetical protein